MSAAVLLVSLGCSSLESPHRPFPTVASDSAAAGTQRLYRLEYGGPEGDGTLRLTLRFEADDSYSLAAGDRLGRALWTLISSGDELIWLDHRRSSYCRRLPLHVLPGLDGMGASAAVVPRLLLGLLPASEPTEVLADDGRDYEVRDGSDRYWRGRRRDGELVEWSLWTDSGPSWWWRRQAGGGILSQRREQRQLRWRETLVEPLAEEVPAPIPPDGYREQCAEHEDP